MSATRDAITSSSAHTGMHRDPEARGRAPLCVSSACCRTATQPKLATCCGTRGPGCSATRKGAIRQGRHLPTGPLSVGEWGKQQDNITQPSSILGRVGRVGVVTCRVAAPTPLACRALAVTTNAPPHRPSCSGNRPSDTVHRPLSLSHRKSRRRSPDLPHPDELSPVASEHDLPTFLRIYESRRQHSRVAASSSCPGQRSKAASRTRVLLARPSTCPPHPKSPSTACRGSPSRRSRTRSVTMDSRAL